MITNILFWILNGVLGIIRFLFNSLNYVIPDQIPNAFNLFFSYVRLGDGIFPMSDVMLAIFTVLQVWVLLYIVKIFLFGFSIIPWIGKYVDLPKHKDNSYEKKGLQRSYHIGNRFR